MPPNFFIVGAPKAGTTSLYYYLDQHPQIYMSPVKEPCHFAPEVMPGNFSPKYRNGIAYDARRMQAYLRGPKVEKRFSGYVPEWADYLSLFEAASKEIAIGEGSVCYLRSPTAARNIAARIPDARIVALLRHPAERAWSQYLHGVAIGCVTKPFREHIEDCLRSPGKEFSPVYPFLEFGMYFSQIRTYFDLFPRGNVKVCFYQDGLAHIVADVLRFLEVDAGFQADRSARCLDSCTAKAPTAVYRTLRKYRLWETLRKFAPRQACSAQTGFQEAYSGAMMECDRQFLCEYYREDVLRLAALLERDLSSWLV